VGSIVALHRSDQHGFSKQATDEVELVAGVGIVGDAHAGPLVQHRSRVAADPTQPNLRQVHLLGRELLERLSYRDDEGAWVRRGGIMAVVLLGGTVAVGDAIEVAAPPGPHRPLQRV
jgi:hypothetical protein